MKKSIFTLVSLASVFIFVLNGFFAQAQPPSGYYSNAEGLYEDALRQSLHNIIDNHNSRSYSQLWSDFEETDKKT